MMPKPEGDGGAVAPAIRVALVDDDDGLRAALQRVLTGAGDIEVVASCPDGATALREIPGLRPDVVLMDINLPDMTGIACLSRLKAEWPTMRGIMLTVYDDGDTLFHALGAGADGYLVKRTPGDGIVDAVREVAAGGAPMSPRIARRMVEYFHRAERAAPCAPAESRADAECRLNEQERQLLANVAEGMAPKEVAAALGLSWGTVRKRLARIYEKLQVHSQTEAVVKFLSQRGK